jgi:hypothetical protein
MLGLMTKQAASSRCVFSWGLIRYFDFSITFSSEVDTSMKKLLILAVALSLFLASPAWARRYGPDLDTPAKLRTATQPVTLVARIGYSRQHGGYYVMNNPRGQSGNKVILNQNYKVLKRFQRSRRAVTIQGRVDPTNLLATYIVIDHLNGRHYRGTHAPLAPRP